MPNELELVLAHVALEQKFVTAPQFGKLLREVADMERGGSSVDLAQLLVQRGLLTGDQLDRLAETCREKGETHLVKGYEIQGILGHGAMGCVYLARQTSMDRMVALKVLPHELARDKHFLERFVREARSTARLNHVNIVQGYDVGYERGLNYFAMELVRGKNLRDLLIQHSKLPERQAADVAIQVGRALQHAWELGIVHRDIKPDNIMVADNGHVKVTDLGLAKPQDGEGDVTRTGMIVGTPNYMSPEQARGTKAIDTRSDLYSLGITLYQLLTGQLPFISVSPTVVMTRHITDAVPSPKTVDPAISDAMSKVVLQLCAKDPAQRYQQPSEMVADLDALLAGRPVERVGAAPAPPAFRFRPFHVPNDDEVYFAQIAMHNRVVTLHQVQRCLELQEALTEVGSVMGLPDVMAEQGILSHRHKEKILEAQRLQPRKEPESFFGRIAAKLGLVDREQVKECLARQRELLGRGVRRRIGDILEDAGYFELKDKVRVLTEQARVRQALENRRFGNIAIRFHFVSRWQLEQALALQEEQHAAGKPVERLGTILVRDGTITEQARKAILRGQRRHEMTGEPLSELMAQVIIEGPAQDGGAPSMDVDLGGLFDNVRIKGAGEQCAYCGHRLRAGLLLCPKCGKEVDLSPSDEPTWGG